MNTLSPFWLYFKYKNRIFPFFFARKSYVKNSKNEAKKKRKINKKKTSDKKKTLERKKKIGQKKKRKKIEPK